MAYLTLDPSDKTLEAWLKKNADYFKPILQLELTKLGVARNDVVYKMLDCAAFEASEPHIEVILKTDNPRVTAPEIVRILSPIMRKVPFEVTRIPAGYWVVEMLYEIHAFIFRVRRNWASNYES